MLACYWSWSFLIIWSQDFTIAISEYVFSQVFNQYRSVNCYDFVGQFLSSSSYRSVWLTTVFILNFVDAALPRNRDPIKFIQGFDEWSGSRVKIKAIFGRAAKFTPVGIWPGESLSSSLQSCHRFRLIEFGCNKNRVCRLYDSFPVHFAVPTAFSIFFYN